MGGGELVTGSMNYGRRLRVIGDRKMASNVKIDRLEWWKRKLKTRQCPKTYGNETYRPSVWMMLLTLRTTLVVVELSLTNGGVGA